MGDNLTLVIQLVAGLMIIFMLLAAYFNSRTWRFLHTFMCFLVFAAATTFVVFAAMTLKTHHAWRSAYNNRKEALEKSLATGARLEFGALPTAKAPAESEIAEAKENLRAVNKELARVVEAVRGRVWRNCVVTQATETAVELDITVDLPADYTDEDPFVLGFDRAKSDAKKLLLQAFTEAPLETMVEIARLGPNKRPDVYVGEYLVDDLTISKDDMALPPALKVHLSLKSRLPLGALQLAALQDRAKSWVLYETMPIDNHEAFAPANLPAEEFKALFPADRFHADNFAALVKEYERDGQPAEESDDPRRKWVKVKFLKNATIDVDAQNASDPSGKKGEYQFFDATGLAVSPLVRATPESAPDPAGKVELLKSEIEAGWEGVFEPTHAEQLIADGTCEKVATIYVRELRDYQHLYQDIYDRMREIDQTHAKLLVDQARIEAATKLCEQQVQQRTEEKTKLQADHDKFLMETAVVLRYWEELAKRLGDKPLIDLVRAEITGEFPKLCSTAEQAQQLLGPEGAAIPEAQTWRGKIKAVFLTNKAQAERLAQLQQKLADEINGRTTPTPPASPPAPVAPARVPASAE